MERSYERSIFFLTFYKYFGRGVGCRISELKDSFDFLS